MGYGSDENVIEFLKDSKTATGTFTQIRHINRIKKLALHRPDECQIVEENPDGSIVAHFPVSWVKIRPPKEVSDLQREIARERMISLAQKRGSTLEENE